MLVRFCIQSFVFFSGDEFLRSDCGMVDLGSAQSDGLADLRTRRD